MGVLRADCPLGIIEAVNYRRCRNQGSRASINFRSLGVEATGIGVDVSVVERGRGTKPSPPYTTPTVGAYGGDDGC